jgi:hypothetical protein
MAERLSLQRECPVCGATLPAGVQGVCPACGIPLATGVGASASDARLRRQVAALNERLLRAGSVNAESAFNLSCGMSLFLVLGAGLLAYFVAGRSWILTLIAAGMASLAGLWIVMLIASMARNNAVRRLFRKEIEPEINDFSQAMRVSPALFGEVVHAMLPEDAPLRRMIPPPPDLAPAPEQE